MKKILIIDDETSYRKTLKKLLEKNSYKVIDAGNLAYYFIMFVSKFKFELFLRTISYVWYRLLMNCT